MNEFFKKFIFIEKEISNKKGGFEFFAILLREDVPDKWDMVISAPWLKKEDRSLLEYIVVVVKKYLSNDIIRLSRVVVLDNNNPAIKVFHSTLNVNHGEVEIKDSNIFGLYIKHAFIITSNKKSEVKKAHS